VSAPLYIIGAGGFGREVLGIIEALVEPRPWTFQSFIDDNPSGDDVRRVGALHAGISGPVEELAGSSTAFYAVLAVGSPRARSQLAARLAASPVTYAQLVHPHATVGDSVVLAEGAVVAAGARLSTNITVARHVHVDQNVTVGHDSSIDEFARLNPQACISGSVTVGARALIGANATVLPGLTIGAEAIVGAGAVVTKDVPPATTVKGVPAR